MPVRTGYVGALRWTAEPPPTATPPKRHPRPRMRYTGPPCYRVPPRWGFPACPWAPPAAGEARRPVDQLRAARSLAGTVVPLLWATAVVALVATGAEVWRYVLLLASREGALSARAVAASDALLASAGAIALILALLAGGLLVVWTVRATRAAADRAGLRPSRSGRVIVAGWLVPGLNLTVPGSVLAEIEHTALARPPSLRPRPSRLLVIWWVLWVAGVILAAVVLVWSLRTGVQALADGVLLHAVLDLLAAITAGVSAVVVMRLTRLLGPVPAGGRRRLVVRVGG